MCSSDLCDKNVQCSSSLCSDFLQGESPSFDMNMVWYACNLSDCSVLASLQWQCPICLKNYSLENLRIDPYFNRITSLVGLHCTFASVLCLILLLLLIFSL